MYKKIETIEQLFNLTKNSVVIKYPINDEPLSSFEDANSESIAMRIVSNNYQNLEEISINNKHNIINIGIGERCQIKNTIVDKNCRIGNDVILNGGKHLEDINTELLTVKDGIIVVKKGVTLPNGFKV